MKYKIKWTKPEEVERKWHIVDVKDQILGRACTQIATLLIGKNKPEIVPNVDCGDYVIVLNSDKVKLTRGKEKKKMYYTHSQYPGGFKEIRFDKLMDKDSRDVIHKGVKNMLPQNKMKDLRMARLFIYKGEEHEQSAQKPVEFKL